MIEINEEFGLLERTAEKLRYLRLSSSARKTRSKRTNHVPTTSVPISPSISETRNSAPSTLNTTGTKKTLMITVRSTRKPNRMFFLERMLCYIKYK